MITKRNVCDWCCNSFPSCDATVEDIEFGDRYGFDNVCNCEEFTVDKGD